MGTERVGKLMGQYAVPCIISLLVGALYNIVDQIFIANASYLGSYGNAANTVVFPLTVVALAIAVMVGDGCCAFVSMALGRNEINDARRSVGNAVVLTVAGSLVLTALYLIFADGIIAMFGGTVNAETFRCSQEYFFYITLGIPFYMFGQAMNPIIRADGNPKFAMISTLAGAVINIILDPIFIFICEWGMMGAAVATVIGQVATALLAVWYLLHMKIIKPASGDYALRGTVCGRMLTLGITSFLSQISLVAAMAAINNMLRKYGALDAVFGQEQYAQIPMAVVGIVMKFFQIVISIVVGMAAGCIPIVGYNMGAEKKLRVRELFTKLLIAEALVGAVALVLAAAMGFAGGFVGAKFGGSGKGVIQQVAPSSTSSSDSGSASAVNTASGMTTAQVSEMVSPSVVVITTEQVVYSQWSWYGQSQVESGAGSGVVISSDGYILTCAHVVSGASNITVTIGDTDYPATVVGEDDTSDVAVLKIDATDLTPATVGNSDSLAVGESVLAVGNPLGELGGTVTSGIVSALNRSVTIQGTSSTNTMSLIQMDASVSPGNSGGGLFNMNGELIGLVNAKSSSSDAEGLGFAIPINDAIKVAQDLLENGYVSGRPYMGITYLAVTDAQTAAQLNVTAYGVYVVDVAQGGPADKAGLKTGDRIVSIDGTEIAQKDDLGTLIQQHAAGDTLSITVAREGQMQTVSLTLGEKNAQTQQAQKNS